MSLLNCLYVGIDVSKCSNQIHAMNSDSKRITSFSSPNDLDGASVKLLFSAYHNLGYSDSMLQSRGIERMDSWCDVKRRLLKK